MPRLAGIWLGYHFDMPATLAAHPAADAPDFSAGIGIFADLAALRAATPALADAAAADIFCTADWFEILSQHGHAEPAACEWWLASVPGAAPLCLPLAVGAQPGSLSNFYSALYGPLGSGSAAAWAALARRLYQDARRWPVLSWQPLDTAASFYREFPAALRRAGYWVGDFHCFGNWTLLLAGRDFAAYFAGLPSRLQNTIRRARRKLERAGQCTIHIQRDGGPGLEAAIADFEAIYQASWKTPEPFPRFIGAWCRRAAERGWLRLGVLTLDGQALAAQLWLVKDGKASIFKLAYREGAQPYSPGSVLTAELMRTVIDDDGVQEVDFLSGDDAYKQDWMSHRRERRGLVAFRPTHWRGLLAAGRHGLGKLRRRLSGVAT